MIALSPLQLIFALVITGAAFVLFFIVKMTERQERLLGDAGPRGLLFRAAVQQKLDAGASRALGLAEKTQLSEREIVLLAALHRALPREASKSEVLYVLAQLAHRLEKHGWPNKIRPLPPPMEPEVALLTPCASAALARAIPRGADAADVSMLLDFLKFCVDHGAWPMHSIPPIDACAMAPSSYTDCALDVAEVPEEARRACADSA